MTLKIGLGQRPLDAWSLAHAAAGYAAGKLGVPFLPAAALLIAFEVFEWGLRRLGGVGAMSEPESPINVAADIGVGLAGYGLGRL